MLLAGGSSPSAQGNVGTKNEDEFKICPEKLNEEKSTDTKIHLTQR